MFRTQLPHEMAGQPDGATPDAQDEIARIISSESVANPFVSNNAGYRGIYGGLLSARGNVVSRAARARFSEAPIVSRRARSSERIVGPRR